MYDMVTRRIQEMEMERKQPARISVAYPADITPIRDKRIKYTMTLVFAALAGGIGLAFLRDKADPSLRSPEDITRLLGVRIIGTTTSPETVEKALLPRQLTEDYQTIRANLGLLDERRNAEKTGRYQRRDARRQNHFLCESRHQFEQVRPQGAAD